jgi:ABC-2 type transport system ATP-binding protein
MTPGIEVEDVQLRYGSVTALDGVTLRLAGGKIHGLLGRNGAGKSSLLAVLAAFRRPTGGTVRVGGRPVFENPEVVRQLCLVRATVDTVESGDKVAEALQLAARLRPLWDADYAERLVDLFELPLRRKLGQLSLGQRSALGVVLGLAARAPVTLFDESYLGMDAPSRYAFYDELLADFMAHPRTFVISTHLVEEVAPLLEEVTILDRGRVLLHEPLDTLLARGTAVTGPAAAVDRLVDGLDVLGEKRLGGTKAAMVYAAFDDGRRRWAAEDGIELGPLPLQDLFVHMTRRSGAPGSGGAAGPAGAATDPDPDPTTTATTPPGEGAR